MIDFWAKIDRSGVEKFAKTLVLPPYMSHLTIRPFSFATQSENKTGREPLKLEYVGEGRLEELTLEPENVAPLILAHLDVGLNLDKLAPPERGAIWTWGAVETNKFGETAPAFDASDEDVLRIYFESRALATEQTAKFDVDDAYVSASRAEIFLSWDVFRRYAFERCREIFTDVPKESALEENDLEPDFAKPTENAAPECDDARVALAWNAEFQPFDDDYEPRDGSENFASARFDDDLRFAPERLEPQSERARDFTLGELRFAVEGRRVFFKLGSISGTFVVAASSLVADVVRFAGLDAPLRALAPYVEYDVETSRPEIDETGVRIALKRVAANADRQ